MTETQRNIVSFGLLLIALALLGFLGVPCGGSGPTTPSLDGLGTSPSLVAPDAGPDDGLGTSPQ